MGEVCPECGGQTMVRRGRYGRFRGCANFPRCRWTGPVVVGRCPVCWGDLVEKQGPKGMFWGCRRHPDCTYTQAPPAEQFERVFGKPFDRREVTKT